MPPNLITVEHLIFFQHKVTPCCLHTGGSLSLDKIHMVGHSLGGHVLGFAGKKLRLSNHDKIGRITGLDPAEPLFKVIDDPL